MAQFAQRWILDFPAVTTVITGASSPDQARDNAQVSELPARVAPERSDLSPEERKIAEQLMSKPEGAKQLFAS